MDRRMIHSFERAFSDRTISDLSADDLGDSQTS